MFGAVGSVLRLPEGEPFADLTPIDLALFARSMPAAGSGACGLLSVAAPAGLRMAGSVTTPTAPAHSRAARGDPSPPARIRPSSAHR